MNKIQALIAKLCPDGVEFRALQDICVLKAGDRIIKSMMKENEKYPVMGGGVVPTGYYKDYNFTQGITIARAGSAGSVAWQENPFWATDVCFVATLPEFCHTKSPFCHTERSEVSKNKKANLENPLDSSAFLRKPQNDKLNLKFVFYFLKTLQGDLQKHIYGGSMPKLDKNYLWNFKIPIPPIEIQKEIVSILDAFTELEAELEARRKQYEHYRERLLSVQELEKRARLHFVIAMDCHAKPSGLSRNDTHATPSLQGSKATHSPSLRTSEASVAKQGKAEVSLVIHNKGIDCHDFANAKSRNDKLGRNDGFGVDCHEVVPTSRNDEKLRHNDECNDALTHNDKENGAFVKMMTLGEVLDYEQPSKYVVKSTEYNNDHKTPVLTAGQTFILGYTNETDGIYQANKQNPCIIFDDFTTSFQWVDFPFKVKSSAMKILTLCHTERSEVSKKSESDSLDSSLRASHSAQNDKAIMRFVYYAMKCVRYSTMEHSRQWIEKYSKLKIPIPPLSVQNEIVEILDKFDALVNDLTLGLPAEIHARKAQYEHYREKLLNFKCLDTSLSWISSV